MKTIILAGGSGTRLIEETKKCPKPMLRIGDRPMLWHIMKIYSTFGFNEFIFALGYKSDYIKKYFINYANYSGNITVKINHEENSIIKREQDDFIIHLEESGVHSLTGGHIKNLARWVHNESFMVTYGDGVSNINIKNLVAYHKEKAKLATITVVRPPARFGHVRMENGLVFEFKEKYQAEEGWINGGFMVFEPQVLDMIKGSQSSLEYDLIEQLATMGELAAYSHDDFWQCMDTQKDFNYLKHLWNSGEAPWKMW
jgi:glucose-1-phosphate cytidylyltransferase